MKRPLLAFVRSSAIAFSTLTLALLTVAAAPLGITFGYDSATSSVCAYDRMSPIPSCAPMGLIDSVNHAIYARTGIDTKAALAAVAVNTSYAGFTLHRHGYYAAGDGGGGDYTYSTSACTLNSGAGDGGWQIRPASGTGCWQATIVGRPSVKLWGAKGDVSIDDGPALRAALNWCTSTGYGGYHAITLPTPPTVYIVNSLDASGLGGLVVNPTAATDGSCRIEGEAENTGGTYVGGVNIKLGANLNRPLLYVPPGVASPYLSHVRLDGNGPQQSGWKGGPGGKLYTVVAGDGSGGTEGSIAGEYVVLTGGYNGNLYVGFGRGATTFYHLISTYSGKDTTDASIQLNGYDAEFYDIGVGSTTGYGIVFAEGSQYQVTGGAFWSNNVGALINGNAVDYLTMMNVNFQYNKCQGLIDNDTAALTGHSPGSHVLISPVFDGNSAGASGACPDVYSTGNTLLVMESPSFTGNVLTGSGRPGGLPSYNISNPSALVSVSNPKFGSKANTSGAFQFANLIQCSNCAVNNIWTPVLAGSLTAGRPAYLAQVGYFSRNNNEITVRFHIQVASLGGAAGNLNIHGLPLHSGSAENNIGGCSITVANGWTGVSGRTTLTALVLPNVDYISLNAIGSGATSAFAQAREFGAPTTISGICTYGLN